MSRDVGYARLPSEDSEVTGRGIFLALEGVEGAGKSTQMRLLGEWLASHAIPHTLAREPGGTPVGEAIRRILLDSGAMEVPPRTELLLMLAARSAYVRSVVRPALDRGDVMVSDRFALSTFAYQGGGRGLDLEEVRILNGFATGHLQPDLTLLFDLPVAEGIARQRESGKTRDRIEREASEFQERVRATYLKMAAADPSVVLVDASSSPEAVHERVREVLAARFPEPFSRDRG